MIIIAMIIITMIEIIIKNIWFVLPETRSGKLKAREILENS